MVGWLSMGEVAERLDMLCKHVEKGLPCGSDDFVERLGEKGSVFFKVHEMDEINPEFGDTDVALVIGANDVTNPSAKTDPASPIYGMPILEVSKAAHVVVIKRTKLL